MNKHKQSFNPANGKSHPDNQNIQLNHLRF